MTEERAAASYAEPRHEERREQRHRVHPGQARARLLERIEPGRELLRVGERREQHAFVAPLLGGDLPERQRGGEARVAIALREPAPQHGVAVGAAQVRDLLFVEILARDVGHQGEERSLPAAQVLLELRHAGVAGRKARLELELRARGRVYEVLVGGEVEEAAHARQNFILEIASYTGPSTASITQPRIRPSTTVSAGSIIACTLAIASLTSRL